MNTVAALLGGREKGSAALDDDEACGRDEAQILGSGKKLKSRSATVVYWAYVFMGCDAKDYLMTCPSKVRTPGESHG